MARSLPQELPSGQVRVAMTAVIKRMFADDRNFNEQGFPATGLQRLQPNISIGTRITAACGGFAGFLAAGLPADHPSTDAPYRGLRKSVMGRRRISKDHAFYEK